MSNWKSKDVSRAADAVRKAMTGRRHSDFLLATALSNLSKALDDGEFRKFCMDTEDGLAVAANTALMYERMVNSLEVIPAQTVWDKIGWEGIVKVTKITTRNERLAVCRAITREEPPVGKQRLADILVEKAPSYSEVRGRGRVGPTRGISKTRAIRERDLVLTTLAELLDQYAVLRSQIPDEVRLLLEVERTHQAT